MYGHCSRSQQLKVKRRRCLFTNSLYSHEVERHLQPDIVLTRNGQGRGGSLILLPFFTESYLIAQESHCTVLQVPCDCQDGIHFNIRSQGSRLERSHRLAKPVGVKPCRRPVAMGPTILCYRYDIRPTSPRSPEGIPHGRSISAVVLLGVLCYDPPVLQIFIFTWLLSIGRGPEKKLRKQKKT